MSCLTPRSMRRMSLMFAGVSATSFRVRGAVGSLSVDRPARPLVSAGAPPLSDSPSVRVSVSGVSGAGVICPPSPASVCGTFRFCMSRRSVAFAGVVAFTRVTALGRVRRPNNLHALGWCSHRGTTALTGIASQFLR